MDKKITLKTAFENAEKNLSVKIIKPLPTINKTHIAVENVKIPNHNTEFEYYDLKKDLKRSITPLQQHTETKNNDLIKLIEQGRGFAGYKTDDELIIHDQFELDFIRKYRTMKYEHNTNFLKKLFKKLH